MTVRREAYIRVAITHVKGDMAYCVPVDEQYQAFDGTGFHPCHLVTDLRAIVAAPLEQQVDPIQLDDDGQKFNRIPHQ